MCKIDAARPGIVRSQRRRDNETNSKLYDDRFIGLHYLSTCVVEVEKSSGLKPLKSTWSAAMYLDRSVM